jgi:hypothetical protein
VLKVVFSGRRIVRDLGLQGLQQRKGSAWPVANAAQSLHSDSLLNLRSDLQCSTELLCGPTACVCVWGWGGGGGGEKCLAIKASARMTSCSSPAPTA